MEYLVPLLFAVTHFRFYTVQLLLYTHGS